MGKIEEKKKEKKQALLASAFQLFTEKGVDNTSVSEIAKDANMAKGTFYLYFKDKYEIHNYLISYHANLIFEKAYEVLNHQVSDKVFDSPEDAVIFLTESIIDQLGANLSLMKFISKNLSWGVFSKIRIMDFGNQNCMDIFDSLLQAFTQKYRQKELMIYMIVELVNATCYNVLLYQEPVRLDELKPELFVAIRNLLKQFEA